MKTTDYLSLPQLTVTNHLVTTDTLDEKVLAALDTKDTTQARLISAVVANLNPERN